MELPKSLPVSLCVKFGIWVAILQLGSASAMEEFWREMQPATQQLINSFITMCEKKGASVDTMKMEDELNDCFSSNLERIMTPIMANNAENPRKIVMAIRDLRMANTLSSEQMDLIGKNIVEPACQLLPAILICSKPYQYQVIKTCSANPDVEKITLDYMEIIIQATCKYNGNRVVDFLAASGMSCFSLIDRGLECFKNITTKEKSFLNPEDICGLLEDSHDCLARTFESCGGKVTLRILNLVLEDVRTWVHGMCVNAKTDKSIKGDSTSKSAKRELGNSIIHLSVYAIFSSLIGFVV